MTGTISVGTLWLDKLQGGGITNDFERLLSKVKNEDGTFKVNALKMLRWIMRNGMYGMDAATPAGIAFYAAVMELVVEHLLEEPDEKVIRAVRIQAEKDLKAFDAEFETLQALTPILWSKTAVFYTLNELQLICEAKARINTNILKLESYRPA
jgi:hypothetical protein